MLEASGLDGGVGGADFAQLIGAYAYGEIRRQAVEDANKVRNHAVDTAFFQFDYLAALILTVAADNHYIVAQGQTLFRGWTLEHTGGKATDCLLER